MLAQKLNLKTGYRGLVMNAPRTFDYSELFWDMMVSDTVTDQPVDFVLLFVHNKAELEAHLAQAKTAVKPDGKLWIAYPKGSSKVETDLNRDKLWMLLKEHHLDVVRQIAVDEVWSAMRFKSMP